MSDKAANISVQTDEFLVSPYEHLFPFVLPQWMSNATESSNNQNGKSNERSENPYDILDQYVEAAYKSAQVDSNLVKLTPEQEIKKLKDELALLHNQLHYERHRREILGLRNRRLLGKTKSSRVLEEQNTSLTDRLKIASSEMAVLSDQLEQVHM